MKPERGLRSFRDGESEVLYGTGKGRRWLNIAKVALRKLDMLDAATTLDDLRSPPGNGLEALGGARVGQHGIRVNDQWRICFRWTEAGAEEVEIADYH